MVNVKSPFIAVCGQFSATIRAGDRMSVVIVFKGTSVDPAYTGILEYHTVFRVP